MTKKPDKKYSYAIEVLRDQFIKDCAEIVSLWLVNKNPEAKKETEAWQFLDQMMSGKFEDKEEYQPQFDKAMQVLHALGELDRIQEKLNEQTQTP